MEIESIKRLLIEVNHISNHYDKVAKLSGENFNVFNILNLQTNEVRTHSSFLSELLNPQGCHGQEDLFLKLFINHFDIQKFDSKSAVVKVEKYIGPIIKDPPTGGKIDILLTDKKGNQITIENKIYAGDQDNQLLRYYNYNPDATLFYLTLLGDPPSDNSTNGKLDSDKYRNISYCQDIIEWLTKCQKEAVNLPIIRETISQYIHLLQNLTNQSTMEKMDDEIKKLIIDNPVYAESIEVCSNALNSIIEDVRKQFNSAFDDKFPKEPILLNDDDKIHIKLDEDGDGVWIGYTYFKSGKNCSDIDLAKKFHTKIKEKKSYVHYSQNYFIWYNPLLFDNRKRFEDIDKVKIIEMYNEKSKITEEVEKIIKQDEEIREILMGIINEL